MAIAVVGRNSLLARIVARHPAAAGWRFRSHDEALGSSDWLDGIDAVVNFAFDFRLAQGDYDPALDVDLKLARLLAARSCRYVMISSRMVYGPPPPDLRLVESMPLAPSTPYGRAKAATERQLRELLGERLTVLRLSNIFAAEERFGERPRFFGMALSRLARNGLIEFDMSPFVERDFLPATVFADRLARILAAPRAGTFNIGAGFPVATGRIAQWLIAGRGGGKLLVSDFREHDGFFLDISLAARHWEFPRFGVDELRQACLDAGRGIGS